jgi:hypothetical protein
MPCDYNNDGQLNTTDRIIYSAFIFAKIRYGNNPTLAQVQERYDTLYVNTHKAPVTTITSIPDLACNDFNNDSKLDSVDRIIYNAYIFARIKYGNNPTPLQVQERYDVLFVSTGKSPATTITSIPNFVF